MTDTASSDMPTAKIERGSIVARIKTKVAVGMLMTCTATAGRYVYNSYEGMKQELQQVKDLNASTDRKIDVLAQEVKDIHSLFLPRGIAKVQP